VNAGNIVTDGFDLTARYGWSTDWGDFAVSGAFTYVNQYTITDLPGFETGFYGTGINDAAGTTGDGKVARSIPDKKGHVTFTWNGGPSSASATVRYISGYDNLAYDQTVLDAQPGVAALATPRFDSYTAVDLQYSYSFKGFGAEDDDATVTVGVLDAFQEEVPYMVETLQRYDPTVYDPRGRRFYVNLTQRF
jgi:hypothetical protein